MPEHKNYYCVVTLLDGRKALHTHFTNVFTIANFLNERVPEWYRIEVFSKRTNKYVFVDWNPKYDDLSFVSGHNAAPFSLSSLLQAYDEP